MQTIGEIIRKQETDFNYGTTTISEYVEFSLSENINKIEAYLNSKHISGEFDALGREKPFFNIVTGASNIWYRATDLDRRNIRIKATKRQDYIKSMLATALLQDYMRKDNFGVFLNDWGRVLARYGSAVSKHVVKNGELKSIVVPWNRLIIDSIDFDNNPVIEVLELTPAQLKRREGYDKEVVKALLNARSARETTNRQKKDNKNDYIKLYEIHGELPLSLLTGDDKDEDTYVQQMHVVSFVAGKEKGSFEDFTLISGQEERSPYYISHLIKEDGRSMAIGAVEHLFQSQWMQNHTVKAIKDQLDMASKLIFQTSDGNFTGRNILTEIENGNILIHSPNQPMTQVNNQSHDTTALQNFHSMWVGQAQQSTSTTDAISGNTMPSGTAYRQVAILNQESHSLFELMTENKGLHLENILREFVLPFLKTKLKSSKEISAILQDHDITKIDSMYVKNRAIKSVNRKVIQTILNRGVVTPEERDAMIGQEEMAIRDELSMTGNTRFFKPSELDDKTWKDILEGFTWDVEVEITNENTDKEVVLTTLTTVMQSIASNPQILQDPNMRMLFNKILEETGRISPVEISTVSTQQPNPQQLQAPVTTT